MDDATNLTSSDATAMDHHRIMEQLLMIVVIHSLLRKEECADNDDDDARELKDMVRDFSMTINNRTGEDQSAVSKELLLAVTQRLFDVQLRSLNEVEQGRVEVSSSVSEHQLMDSAAAAKKTDAAAAKKKKKMRNKRNKAAAKHGGTRRMSWLGGGIISLLMMAAALFGSLSLIHQSDGSSGGKAPPTLPPSTSTSLRQRQRDVQSSNDMASTSPIIISPLAAVVQPPIFLPAAGSSRRMKSDRALLPTTSPTITNSPSSSPSSPPSKSSLKPSSSPLKSATPSSSPSLAPSIIVSTPSPTESEPPTAACVNTPGWANAKDRDCKWYENHGKKGNCGGPSFADIGSAKEHCCYCGGGSRNCEDLRSKCQDYFNDLGIKDGVVAPLCEEAESCSCEAADDFKLVYGSHNDSNETVGLYNECKCDFWFRLCEDTGVGEACDYAAEYCCGDYISYVNSEGKDLGIYYLNSPLCYCDFFNYAQKEFGHTLKSKALNVNEEFPKPCGQFQYLRNYVLDNLAAARLDVRILLERPSLEAMYKRTNGQNWKNSSGWMNGNHCQWHGISCDNEGFVSSINLRDNNLTGQFPTYTRNADFISASALLYLGSLGSTYLVVLFTFVERTWVLEKYGLANLYSLKMVDLADNKLTGTIDYRPLYNLYSLTHFDVSGNQLSGEVEALVAPSLAHADFSGNRFTSMHRFEKYKVSPLQTLRYCDVSNNAIHEDVTDLLENVPPNIEQFIASNNQIYGSLPASLDNLQKLRQFNMSSNALSGVLPGFVDSILSLQELDMSNQNQTNGFTGSIPGDIWRFQSLKVLNLAGNKLAGTIPPTIGNMAVLEVFDLSNNLLDSSLPPELGMLEGSLKHLGLSNNMFTGTIPSQIGQLQSAAVFLKLKENHTYDLSKPAPLNLCLERKVKEFDLADDIILCPTERNALSDFYDSAKGAEWTDQGSKTDGSLWLDEYASYCDWKGVTCDDDKNHVIKLNLANNGLSGRLSESIGILEFIKVLDLSDNDIKGSIPAELGKLKNLTYLRLSYNAFKGAAPEELGELTQLQLLQLQSNRITELPNMPPLNDSTYGNSTFVTDCGVPSAFDEALKCEHCTMCCNANDDCYPQEETKVAEWGLNYGTFAAILFACFFVLLIWCMFVLFLNHVNKHKNRGGNISTTSTETKIKEDDKYAMSKIGKDSVYSYFITDNVSGWLLALATLGVQIVIITFFIKASEANLQDDKIDIQFTWKCPRDKDTCENKADLTDAGWFIFCVLMVAFLAKDFISGSELIYHSAESRHSLKSRIRYFFGGMCLCWITLFALYVSTIYNKAIATSNTEIIVNSVIILFVMEMDERIFSALTAWNEKWTVHAEDRTIDEMKEELRKLREIVQSMQESQVQYIYKSHKFRGNRSRLNRARMLREIVQKRPESQAATTTTTTSDSDSECEGDTNAR